MVCSSLEALKEELRKQQKDTGETFRAIQAETGISPAMLIAFRDGSRRMSFERLDILATYFGVRYNLKNY